MLRVRDHGGSENSRLFFGFSHRASSRGKAKRWIDFFVIWPFTCLYIFNGLIIVFNEAKRYFLFVLWFTPMNWKSWSAASKCRKTHPCDYRISKFSWGACPRNPLGGKPSRPCQFFARVSNSVALLFKTLMNPLVVRFITHENKPCNLIRCSRQVQTWVVKWATSLFNLFCSNVTKQVARFL